MMKIYQEALCWVGCRIIVALLIAASISYSMMWVY